jgi:hypothetical protein
MTFTNPVVVESTAPQVAASRGSKAHLSGCEKLLVTLFVLTLPLVNPWVRSDGVGYYAYAHSLLIDGDLNFENEWQAASTSFRAGALDESGQVRPQQYTRTGRLNNHFTVGPSILWAPFLVTVHLAVGAANRLGAQVPADGFSWPYGVAMAVGTAFYGFWGLLLAFRLAREYFAERWSFLATLGIWFASALPVYMYFNPSWSNAHSAFTVSLFLWYWHRTRQGRTLRQWIGLAFIGGLMINVYYPNALALLAPLFESLESYRSAWSKRPRAWTAFRAQLVSNGIFVFVVLIAMLPTFVTRQIIYGGPLETGHPRLSSWFWTSPKLWDVLFSSNHGLLAWNPILIPAVVGLYWVRRRDRQFGTILIASLLALYYVIASYTWWNGISSFGNRFFVSLTPVFVLGLAAFLSRMDGWFKSSRLGVAAAALAVSLLAAWNVGIIYQWGTNVIPNRGHISWSEVARNQATVVPANLLATARTYFLGRMALMEQLEREDIREMRRASPR